MAKVFAYTYKSFQQNKLDVHKHEFVYYLIQLTIII